jgi:sterol O-acyltransferase
VCISGREEGKEGGRENFEFYKFISYQRFTFFFSFLPHRLVLEFNLLAYAFGKFPTVIWTWWAMFLSTLSIPYFLFQRWAHGYSKSSHPLIYSLVHGLLFLVFQLGVLGFVPTYVVLAYTLPPASRFILILEQVRI